MQQITVEQATAHLTDWIEAAMRGEEIFIRMDNQTLVQLLPIPEDRPHPRYGSAKGMIVMADDFDDPLPGFENYIP